VTGRGSTRIKKKIVTVRRGDAEEEGGRGEEERGEEGGRGGEELQSFTTVIFTHYARSGMIVAHGILF
jgi:hypothetical protein